MPYVALTVILGNMKHSELICLSLCSQKSNYLIKINYKVALYGLRVHDAHLKSIEFLPDSKDFLSIQSTLDTPIAPTFSVTIGRIKDIKCSINPNFGYFESIWDDKEEGVRILAGYTCDLFRTRIKEITIYTIPGLWMLDWARWWDLDTVKVDIWRPLDQESYGKILRFTSTKTLEINAGVPTLYHFSEKLPAIETCIIRDGTWLKVSSLLSMEFQNLKISCSILRNESINALLRRWLNGGCSNLRYFQVRIKNLSEDKIYEGLRNRLERVEGTRTYKWKESRKTNSVTFSNGYNLRRRNGTIGTCFKDDNIFFFAVWPDSTGQIFLDLDN